MYLNIKAILCAAVFCLFLAGAALAASPVGKWKTIDDETGKPKSVVQIWEENGRLYGRILELINPSTPNPICDKCEGKRKDQPIEGMTILWDMHKDGETWKDGKILDPKKGKIYDCKLWLEGDKLKVRGYVGIFFRTQTWQPAD